MAHQPKNAPCFRLVHNYCFILVKENKKYCYKIWFISKTKNEKDPFIPTILKETNSLYRYIYAAGSV